MKKNVHEEREKSHLRLKSYQVGLKNVARLRVWAPVMRGNTAAAEALGG